LKKLMILSFALLVLPLLTSFLLVQCSTERKERIIWVGRTEYKAGGINEDQFNMLVITSYGNVYVLKQELGETGWSKERTWTKLCRLAERDDFVSVYREGSLVIIGCEDGTIYYSPRGHAVLDEGEGSAGVVIMEPRLSFSAIK